MAKNTAYKILNPILAVLAVNQGVTIVLRDRMTGKAFVFFHETIGVIFMVLIIVHFILNLNWFKANYFCKTGKDKE
jgi:hypothetical protein